MVVAAVQGTLEERGPGYVVVAIGGLSLRLFAPNSTLAHLGPIGAPVRLLTYLLVREDALALYGFATADERALFEQLLTVSGVGPRGALALLSAMEVETLRQAIVAGDTTRLTLVPGIGKKTAERLALELRGKLGPRAVVAEPRDEMAADVAAALATMGFTPQQVQQALDAAASSPATTLEQRILAALEFLRRLGTRGARG
ncbi:MAG: Holliday junction branch migration protein RuvA [Chloroflexi bacterium]|nr:Holliday junction branch migration protein RuvA [Chloroflexota bacterium]